MSIDLEQLADRYPDRQHATAAHQKRIRFNLFPIVDFGSESEVKSHADNAYGGTRFPLR